MQLYFNERMYKMGKNADGVIVIPKQLKNITDLYRSCQFEKADMLLEKLDKLPNQILSIKAQLAFFKWDFDRSVELILGYYDHLDEWYSANAQNDTILMLTFSLLKCSGDVKENANRTCRCAQSSELPKHDHLPTRMIQGQGANHGQPN